ncbi:hypothetical protein N7495_009559 [Penicillium taxi]|uniref:uncharacterized protein n=1 Tax=Penicillium taxi TaxID=168475 RepID=UPI0025451E55|nr:uncharacterized protein N7495_009559 [Penicillium taxi]KAJ5885049.1 hypothetical protein N7495_009559 [Penicillium taxi]
MSLQVHDPRSRTRSKSPGHREHSRSRDNRPHSPTNSRSHSRQRSKSPAIAIAQPRKYDVREDEAQYKRKESTRHEDSIRASRSPARYDVRHSNPDEHRSRDRSRRPDDRYDGRYDHSDDDHMRVVQPREHTRSHQRMSSTSGRNSRRSSPDSSDDEHLAYGDGPGSHPSYAQPGRYQYAQPSQFTHAQPTPRQSDTQIDWASVPECERPGFVPPSSSSQAQPSPSGPGMPGAFPSGPTAPTFPMPQYSGTQQTHYAPVTAHGGTVPSHQRVPSTGDPGYATSNSAYAQPNSYQYAQVDPKVRYTSKTQPKVPYTASAQEQFSQTSDHANSEQFAKMPEQPSYPIRYTEEPQFGDKHSSLQPQLPPRPNQHQFVEITPGGGRRPHSLSVSSANNLAVAGAPQSGYHPPASPLLEPYQGTYQSMSPMPSPIVIPSIKDDEISDVELDGAASNSETRRKKHMRTRSSDNEARYRSSNEKIREKSRDRGDRDHNHRKEDKHRSRPSTHDRHDSSSSLAAGDSLVLISPTTSRKRVSFYDADADAEAMKNALNHARSIDNKTLIHVLPPLSSDEILLLRHEYKNRVKMHGKGVNLAKHLRLKLGSSSFAKVCYATALGRWESEAYWANCYYQVGTSRRELLIESLTGRSNAAIREIKAAFRDTRYDNSLERCMRAELRADKFRTAILLALQERRQGDRDPIDLRLVRQDVSDLHRALVAREGGETAMIEIIVVRSDAHLREVLRSYEGIYGQNFARAMIAKSRNLIGETLAHILNGAINRPMRDALLLHQALRESRSGRERSELLISRLVRLHWEPRHMELVKSEYRRRYGDLIEEAIAEEVLTTSGGSEWGEFCIELVHSSRP